MGHTTGLGRPGPRTRPLGNGAGRGLFSDCRVRTPAGFPDIGSDTSGPERSEGLRTAGLPARHRREAPFKAPESAVERRYPRFLGSVYPRALTARRICLLKHRTAHVDGMGLSR